jgi:hypothetical protein
VTSDRLGGDVWFKEGELVVDDLLELFARVDVEVPGL